MICTEKDDWLLEQDKTMWICYLENGLTVYQDDYRPHYYPESAWKRLKLYCQKNQVDIQRMEIRFRSNCKLVGDGADGYFFSHCAGAWMGQNTINYFIVGCINERELRTVKWRIPELLEDEVEIRDIKASDECLILKKNLTINDFQQNDYMKVNMEEEVSHSLITSVN